ncbi:MAG: serine/threonine protein kinase [Kiritimatiellia bacterium]
MSLLPTIPQGTRFGPHTTVSEVGRGATAVVMLARHDDGHLVAIKARPRGVPAADRRFLREFESMRALRLPGVVRVFAAGIDGGNVWFSMEYVEGRSFLEFVSTPISAAHRVDRVLDISCQLLDVLNRLHTRGMIHQDIKPSNVLVDHVGRVHVLDFGIGRFFAQGGRRSEQQGTVGTMPYMAPEQLAGTGADHTVDLFATGLMIWEALHHERQSPANPLGWITRTCLERLQPLAGLHRDIPKGVSAVVERLLDVDPVSRPSAAQAALDLRRLDARSQEWPAAPFRDPGPWLLDSRSGASDEEHRFSWVLQGPAGSGRRAAIEFMQRHGLLEGMRTLHVRCEVTSVGGPILQALELLLSDSDGGDWSSSLTGGAAGALRQMWPHLPLPVPPHEEPVPTMTRVAKAAANTLIRAARQQDLLIVVHNLEQVDLLTARALHLLAIQTQSNLSLILLHDPRWATDQSRKVLEGLHVRGAIQNADLPTLSTDAANDMIQSICPTATHSATAPMAPQMAAELAYQSLAAWRGERWTTPEESLWPLAVHEPIPEVVYSALVGPDALNSPWLRRTERGVELAGDTARRAVAFRLDNVKRAATQLADVWTEALGDDADPADLARLRLLAGTPERARWHAVAAAVQSIAAGRYADARRWLFLYDALPRGGSSPIRPFAVASAMARVALITEAETPRDMLVDSCEAEASSDEDHAEVALIRATYLLRKGQPRPALVAALRLASAGRAPTTEITVRALEVAIQCRLVLGQLDEAGIQLNRAEALLAGIDDQSLHTDIAHRRAELLLRTQVLDAAGAQLEALLLQARQRGHLRSEARAAHNLAQVLRLVGRRHRAEKLARAACTAASTTGDLALLAEARLLLATLLTERGDAPSARTLLDASMRRLRGLRLDHLLPWSLLITLQLATAQGKPDEADLALAVFRAHPDTVPEAAAMRVRWWRTRNDLQAALAVPPPPPNTWAWILFSVECARAHLSGRQPLLATELAGRARTLAAERGFDELELYARLIVHAAIDPGDRTWRATCTEATSAVWTELCFGAIELDARRLANAGDHSGAVAQWQALRTRCEEFGYHPGLEEAVYWLDASH